MVALVRRSSGCVAASEHASLLRRRLACPLAFLMAWRSAGSDVRSRAGHVRSPLARLDGAAPKGTRGEAAVTHQAILKLVKRRQTR